MLLLIKSCTFFNNNKKILTTFFISLVTPVAMVIAVSGTGVTKLRGKLLNLFKICFQIVIPVRGSKSSGNLYSYATRTDNEG